MKYFSKTKNDWDMTNKIGHNFQEGSDLIYIQNYNQAQWTSTYLKYLRILILCTFRRPVSTKKPQKRPRLGKCVIDNFAAINNQLIKNRQCMN